MWWLAKLEIGWRESADQVTAQIGPIVIDYRKASVGKLQMETFRGDNNVAGERVEHEENDDGVPRELEKFLPYKCEQTPRAHDSRLGVSGMLAVNSTTTKMASAAKLGSSARGGKFFRKTGIRIRLPNIPGNKCATKRANGPMLGTGISIPE